MSTNTATTTNSPKRSSSGFGDKLKGAAEIVHGAGEQLRGTILGALDSFGSSTDNKNSEIAANGKAELERGMSKMRGTPTPTYNGYPAGSTAYYGGPKKGSKNNWSQPGTGPMTETAASPTQMNSATQKFPPQGWSGDANDPSYGGPNNAELSSRPFGGTDTVHQPPVPSSQPYETYPSHHREDAIAGVPQKELAEVQSINAKQEQQGYGAGYVNGAGYEAPPLHPNRPVN